MAEPGPRSASGASGFGPYPVYKDSGVEWLGEIPEHWEVRRLKHVAHVNAGQSPPSALVRVGHDGTPFLQGNAEFGRAHPTPTLVCDAPPRKALPGDILLSVRAPVGALNLADQEYGIGRGLCAIRPAASAIVAFFHRVLMTTRFRLNVVATGSTYDAVTASDIGDLLLPFPPASEQQAVANHLDRETAKTDALIVKQQQLMELLQEKRTALISRAVTNGLDPSAPVRDSWIEWLGEIPAHWKVRRLKSLCSRNAEYGANVPASCYSTTGVRFVRTSDIGPHGNLIGTGVFLPGKLVGDYVLADGDLLISRSGTIGRSFVFDRGTHGPCAYAGYLVRFVPAPVLLPKYAFYFTKSRPFSGFVGNVAVSSTIDNVSGKKYARCPVPLPSTTEQREIVRFLDRETAKIDALIAKITESIDLLDEYRAALISAAVTGKIDVRDHRSATPTPPPTTAETP